MMYRDYPRVKPEFRLALLEEIRAAAIRVTPAEALVRSGLTAPPSLTRLSMLEGRPVYRFHGPRRSQYAIYADTGERVEVSEDLARRVAARFAQLPAGQARLAERLEEADQWTVNKLTRSLSPFLKFAFYDRAGTEVYVSQRTGEMIQFTRRDDRFWGYLGAVVHWWYFTPLRLHTDFWRALIIGVSFTGTLMTLAGIGIGVWLYSPSKKYKLRDAGPSSIPYSGWKRWHYGIGLGFGLCTFTWILSGMFSMNPFLWSPATDVDPEIEHRFKGGPVRLDAFSRLPLSGGEKEIEFRQFQGRPLLLAVRSPRDTEMRFADGLSARRLMREELVAAARASLPAARVKQVEWLEEYDAYYTDRRGEKRLPLLRVRFDDPPETWLHIDPYSAAVFESYVSASRVERWVYHGLHSLDFPLLYKYRPAWDIVVLSLMSGGTVLCVTSVWIGWKRLRKGWRDLRRRAPAKSTAKAEPARV
jgi:hypothetical protein